MASGGQVASGHKTTVDEEEDRGSGKKGMGVFSRARPVTADSSQKQATGTLVSRGGRYTRARNARRWSRAMVKWEMSTPSSGPLRDQGAAPDRAIRVSGNTRRLADS